MLLCTRCNRTIREEFLKRSSVAFWIFAFGLFQLEAGGQVSEAGKPYVLIDGTTGSEFAFTNRTSVSVELRTSFVKGTIFYTLDGSAPGLGSSVYTLPITITNSVTIRAKAYSSTFDTAESEAVVIRFWFLHALATDTNGGGAIQLDPPGGTYRNDAVVRVTATPIQGWSFLQWKGDLSGTEPIQSLSMDRLRAVEAVFGTEMKIRNNGNGSIRINPNIQVYPYGSSVQLIAIPDPGYFFALWGGDMSSNTNPLSIGVTNADPTVSALFTALGSDRVSLTVLINGKGSIDYSPRANVVSKGQGVTFTPKPDPNEKFYYLSDESSGALYFGRVTMDSSKIITANFSGGTYPTSLKSSEYSAAAGPFRFTVLGEPSRSIAFEVSTNLVDWSFLNIGITLNTNGLGTFTDNNAKNSRQRFYRSRLFGR